MCALRRQIEKIESGKSYGITKDVPDVEARKAMMLERKHVDAIRAMKHPSETLEKTMGLWLLMLDSFGFDLIPKVHDRIAEALKAKKDQQAAQFAKGVWPTVLSQLQQISLDRTKLWKLSELMARDPVNAETFKLARKYANEVQVSIKDEAFPVYDERVATALSEEFRLVATFNSTVLQFQRKL